jgi:hypothetical protein
MLQVDTSVFVKLHHANFPWREFVSLSHILTNMVIEGTAEDILLLVWKNVNTSEMLYYKISQEI